MDQVVSNNKTQVSEVLPWKSNKTIYEEGLWYMEGRRTGKIKSFKTSLDSFNEAGLDGIEYHSAIILGARPGDFKTSIVTQFIKNAFELNVDPLFRILNFSFDMYGRTTAIREFTSVTNKSYKELCSAGSILDKMEIDKCSEYAKIKMNLPIDRVDEPCTVAKFKEIIMAYMSKYALRDSITKEFIRNDFGKIIYPNVFIPVDHSLLFEKDRGERDTLDMLYNLGRAVNFLRKIYPIAFLILSQLNRSADAAERNENGRIGNYLNSTDLFGSDALYQYADGVVLYNRPGKKGIHWYGPENYIIEDEFVLVGHWVKTRNGANAIVFHRADGKTMTIKDIATLQKAEKIQQFKKKKE